MFRGRFPNKLCELVEEVMGPTGGSGGLAVVAEEGLQLFRVALPHLVKYFGSKSALDKLNAEVIEKADNESNVEEKCKKDPDEDVYVFSETDCNENITSLNN